MSHGRFACTSDIVHNLGLQVGLAAADQPGVLLSRLVAALRQLRGDGQRFAIGQGRFAEHTAEKSADGLAEVRELPEREQGVPVFPQRRHQSEREPGSHVDARVVLTGAQSSGRGIGTPESPLGRRTTLSGNATDRYRRVTAYNL